MSASSAPSFATSSRRASRTPWVVLGLLAYEPMTGYDLKAAIQATVGHFWQESYGQLYPTLHALRDDGLVTMTHEADGGRTRNVYAITDEGRAAVLAWLAEDPRPTPHRHAARSVPRWRAPPRPISGPRPLPLSGPKTDGPQMPASCRAWRRMVKR